jgi:hypothetical protein
VILVDTSVWIDHLRAGDAQLSALLEGSNVAMHPMVLGELACGNLKDRETLLALWCNLPQLPAATDAEALFFTRAQPPVGARHRLHRRAPARVRLAEHRGQALDPRQAGREIAEQLGLAHAEPDA